MKKFLSFLYVFLVLLFVYAPIILMFIYSFNTSKTINIKISPFADFSFEPFINIFAEEELRSIILDTLFLALFSSLIATLLGTLGAIGVFYNKKWLGKFVKSASQIPVINAEIVTAISIALLFAFLKLKGTYFALLVGHVAISSPFVMLSVLPKLKQMDGSLYEAALDLGATPFQALCKVIIPEILPGILSGFMLAITLSLDDYMISAYTKPVEFDTISTYVFGAIKKPKNAFMAELRALSTIILFIMILVILILNLRTKKENTIKQRRTK
ncbi:MAG: ABC transporter permease [Clostridia bacterium]|nr:ABC transporter permease [Clostridia bacterium]